MNKVIWFICGATRPAISIIFAGVIAQVITQQIDIPEYQWLVLVGFVGWWFRDRTVLHNRESAKGEDKKSGS